MNSSNPSGFFTLGVRHQDYDLPHRKLGLPVILLIQRVLCRAFELLRDEVGSLAGITEDEVTAALRSVIENNLRQNGTIRGFSWRTYESVVRQGEVANFDGTKHTKSPDLCFKLRRDEGKQVRSISEFDALFVECKPVDRKHAAGSTYCDLGIIRFVEGDYAWAMQEGMMLAYVRSGRAITTHLIPAMQGSDRMESLSTTQLPAAYMAKAVHPKNAELIHVSKHRRNFEWPGSKGKATEITLYHLWHDCN